MIDLYSSPTPNGRKITIMLEELRVKYNSIFINLEQKEQFSDDFSKISPTNKIPVIVDKDNNQKVFESGAILLYLAKKYNKFLNEDNYWEIIQWVFFQMAYVGPMLGQAHQYLFYNPGKSKFAEEKTKGYVKHIYEILDKRLSKQEFFSTEYSIADIAIWPWTARFERHQIDLNHYPNVLRWYLQISERPAVIKGYNIVGNFFEIPKP
ncbi:glutathione S-transferase N-terminal domain-containing protein [Pelagibacteraceae bacterium]|nr:glutathione S-transferase N-terminal domain-containing protein [Pelagibacteraceae bacterium]